VSPPRRQGPDDARPELGPLPGGHHGLSREQVLESQRERLLAAFAQILAARGYQQTNITEIVKVASVSSKAFYENFESKEACFLAAFDAVLGYLQGLVTEQVAPIERWPEQVVAALRALLGFFAAEPDLARLCLVEPLTATPVIAARFREVVIETAPYLRAGRAERPENAELPGSTEESLLGGLVVLTSRSVLAGEPLPPLLPDLVEFVLAPYLGARSAREIAAAAGAGR
jgi:AcrR family transcriptional regulator